MAFRLYIVPVVGAGTSRDPRRPKYFADGTLPSGTAYAGMDYGFEPWFVVGADLTVSQDNLVVGQPDAFALPFDLAPALSGAQVTSVKNKLEAANLPAGWVTTSLTWLQVVRTVLGMISFMQRYAVVYAEANDNSAAPLFGSGITMNSTFASLPLAVRNALVATAQSFGIPTTGLSGSTTVRTILKAMADQFQGQQFDFNGTMI